MASLNVLLINIPPVSIAADVADNTTAQYIYPPLGCISLGLKLLDESFVGKVKILDFAVFDFSGFSDRSQYDGFIYEKFKETALISDFDAICISVMFSLSHEFFRIVADKARMVFNNCSIICGGIHPTNAADYIMESVKNVDFILRGEGETALPALLADISGGKAEKRKVIDGGGLPSNIDLDFQKYPQLFDIGFYADKTSLFSLSLESISKKAFAVMASRGCPVRCTFCAARTVHGIKPRWRSIDNVRDEILWLNKNYGVTKIYLMDDNFVPKGKAIELFKMLSDIAIENLEILIQNMSVNHTDFEIIDAVIAARIKYIPLAIESGSAEMQKKIKKNCDLEKAKKLVRYAQKNGANVRCFYIVGFPGETISQINETVAMASEIGADWSSFNVAVPFPGTEMYDEFVSLGYIEDSPDFWSASTIRDRVFNTNEYSAEQIKTIAYEANLKVNFVNSPYILNKEYEKGKMIFENFVSSVEFHIFAYDCLRRISLKLGEKEEADKYAAIMKEKLATDPKALAFSKYFYLLDEDIVAQLRNFE